MKQHRVNESPEHTAKTAGRHLWLVDDSSPWAEQRSDEKWSWRMAVSVIALFCSAVWIGVLAIILI